VPDDVGLDEGAGPVDGAVHVALGGQMHDHVGPEALEDLAHAGCISDVGLLEGVAGSFRDGGERGEVARIGELVDHQHHMRGVPDDLARHRRADEPGPTRYKNLSRHRSPP
jgi:hypothetical protein